MHTGLDLLVLMVAVGGSWLSGVRGPELFRK
jgi:hypothetical protein